MKSVDPGHVYELSVLDKRWWQWGFRLPRLVFVKRKGSKFPGNTNAHSGTTLQEVLRACLDRLSYLDRQEHHMANQEAREGIEKAIVALEDRASERHSRAYNGSHDCCYGPQCYKCLHVGCEGQCHP